MARLYEYQGKKVLSEVGTPIPKGGVASTKEEARKIAASIDGPVAVKAQIWATGRFKAGGIKFADNPEEAEKAADELLGSKIKDFGVEKVLVEQKLDIDKEYYAGVITDSSYKVRAPVVMFSSEGGVDIEEVAEKSPEKISSLTVNVFRGIKPYDAYNLVLGVGVQSTLLRKASKAILGLYEAFRKYDARSAEINPLVLTEDGEVLAADCRISVDDSSVFRHPELGIDVPRERDKPPTEFDRLAHSIEEGDYRGVAFLQEMAKPEGLGYVGYHGIGGGGAILGVDALNRQGLKIANYADTSGNPTAAKVYRVAKLILSQPNIEAYVLAGHIVANQEQWHHAHGVVKALREGLTDKPGFPVVLLLCGNKEKESLEILEEGLKDLPIRLEIYGSDRVLDSDFIANRMKSLIDEYRAERGVETNV